MHVGVLGGGLQGCSVALALADRGADVVLFDRNTALCSRTAVANEGKIHLGYMYAGDPTLATARMMLRGALAFGAFFEKHLGIARDSLVRSEPAAYVVHRDTQHHAAEVEAYLRAVHSLVAEAADAREGAYFGAKIGAPLRVWTARERDAKLRSWGDCRQCSTRPRSLSTLSSWPLRYGRASLLSREFRCGRKNSC